MIFTKNVVNILVSLTLLFLLSACSSVQPTPSKKSPQKRASTTLVAKGQVPLLKSFSLTDKALAGKSAFYPLNNPVDAFAARLFLIDHATTSLDVQYYIYHDDKIGNIFSAHLIEAAQRGVKVRILLDDMDTVDQDAKLTELSYFPNIELRLFNPNFLRTSFRNIALLLDVNRLGKRMHNKALIADGSAAIIGGRNIGEGYFAVNKDAAFLDYDMLMIGKVIPDISKGFDTYWNSKESVPAKQVFITDKDMSTKEVQRLVYKKLKAYDNSAYAKRVKRSNFTQEIKNNTLKFTVAKESNFYYDPPSKVSTNEDDDALHIAQQIRKDLKNVDHHIIIISPYFIPSEEMMVSLQRMRSKNVKVSIITNSLASTDVFAVYGGYKDAIKPLVDMGVDLYEIKGSRFKRYLRKKKKKNISHISLHTKMMVVDDERLMIGSANLDPRSDKLNTEYFMVISCAKLVKGHRESLEKVLNMNYMYKVGWGEHPHDEEDTLINGPIWKTLEKGKVKTYYSPPKTSLWKMIGADITSLLPIKGYL